MKIFKIVVDGEQSGYLEEHVVLARTIEGAMRTALADMKHPPDGYEENLRVTEAGELYDKYLTEPDDIGAGEPEGVNSPILRTLEGILEGILEIAGRPVDDPSDHGQQLALIKCAAESALRNRAGEPSWMRDIEQ